MATALPPISPTASELQWYRKAMVLEVVQKLRATGVRQEKEHILEMAVTHTKYFRDFLIATYHPTIQYYILKIPPYKKAKNFGNIHLGTIFANKMLDVLVKRQRRGAEAEKYLEFLLSELNSFDAEVLEMIIKRDMDADVGIKTINKAVKGLIPEYPVMLCEQFDESYVNAMAFPIFVQTKEDGARGNLITREKVVSTMSRNGKSFGLDDAFQFVATKAPGTYVLDGEFLVLEHVGGDKFLPRKKSNGILNKISQGTASAEDIARVVFVAWDLIGLKFFDEARICEVPYETRFAELKKIVAKVSASRETAGKIRVVESAQVHSLQDAQSIYQRARERNLEGVILKSRLGPWEPKRSRHQIKLKQESSCDLEVVDFTPGTGKYSGSLGSLLCRTRDGKLEVSVGTGLTDAQRHEIWANKGAYQGKVIEVVYNELIESKDGSVSLFLPRFGGFREGIYGKDVADALEDLQK